MDETKQLTTPGLEKRFVGVHPPTPPQPGNGPLLLLAPRFTQDAEGEAMGEVFGWFAVHSKEEERERTREMAREGGKGKVARAADFYS
jgi:hypothetical protein